VHPHGGGAVAGRNRSDQAALLPLEVAEAVELLLEDLVSVDFFSVEPDFSDDFSVEAEVEDSDELLEPPELLLEVFASRESLR